MRKTTYHDLNIWRTARDLAETCRLVAGATASGPADDLPDKIRDIASSLPAKIAEAYASGEEAFAACLIETRASLLLLEELIVKSVQLGQTEKGAAETLSLLARSELSIVNALMEAIDRKHQLE